MRIIIKITALWLLVVSKSVFAVEFSLFGDTTLQKSENSQQFNLGGLNLTAEQDVSETSYIIAEILFEFAQHGYDSNVTRFSITKKLSSKTEVYAGKFVKGLGLWHQTFHHGSLALDTISLPFFVGGTDQHHSFVAAHIVGAGVTSSIGDFSYQLALANQPGINSSEPTPGPLFINQLDRNSPASDFATLIKLNYAFNWKTEISLFAHMMDVIELDSAGDSGSIGVAEGEALFEQQQFGVNFLYAGDKFSSFMEFYQLRTKDNPLLVNATNSILSGQPNSYLATLYYLQMGWKFSNVLSASVRHEGLDYSAGNSFFQVLGVAKQTRNVLGVNYRLDESNALRFEVKKIDYDGSTNNLNSETVFGVQWFFLLL